MRDRTTREPAHLTARFSQVEELRRAPLARPDCEIVEVHLKAHSPDDTGFRVRFAAPNHLAQYYSVREHVRFLVVLLACDNISGYIFLV